MKNLMSGKASIYVLAAALAVASFLLGRSITQSFAAGDVDKAYCHAAGQAGSTHFEYKFNKAWDAHFLDNGTPKAGHELDFYTWVGDENCVGWTKVCTDPSANNYDSNLDANEVSDNRVCTYTPLECDENQYESDGECVDKTSVCGIRGYDNYGGQDHIFNENTEIANDDLCANNQTEPTATPVPTPEPTPVSCSGDTHPDATGTRCVNFEYGGPSTSGGTGGQVLGASTMAKAGGFEETLYQAIMGLGGISTVFGFKNLKKASKKA